MPSFNVVDKNFGFYLRTFPLPWRKHVRDFLKTIEGYDPSLTSGYRILDIRKHPSPIIPFKVVAKWGGREVPTIIQLSIGSLFDQLKSTCEECGNNLFVRWDKHQCRFLCKTHRSEGTPAPSTRNKILWNSVDNWSHNVKVKWR